MTTYSKPASRRRHSAELKANVLAACEAPGVSVAAVAQAHGLNANLVHKWRRGQDTGRLASAAGVAPARAADVSLLPPVTAPAATRTLTDTVSAFVPVQLEMPRAAPADIRLELRRGAATVIVTWPAQEAATCGTWLREWLG